MEKRQRSGTYRHSYKKYSKAGMTTRFMCRRTAHSPSTRCPASLMRRRRQVRSQLACSLPTSDSLCLQRRIRENHGSLDLPLRDVPVLSKKRRRLGWRHTLEAMTLIETDSPFRSGPRADEDRARRGVLKMPQQSAADTVMLAAGKHVSVADQVHIAHVLDTHHSNQLAVHVIA